MACQRNFDSRVSYKRRDLFPLLYRVFKQISLQKLPTCLHWDYQGRIQECFIGGSKLLFRKTFGLFWGKLLFPTPPPPSPHSRLYIIIPWPLTVYLDSTRKGYTLGTSSSCVWLQKLNRFCQHQCQGHDVPVSAWVHCLTTAHLTSCFYKMQRLDLKS